MEPDTVTPASDAALGLLSALPMIAVVAFGVLIILLTILMPYYVYRAAVDLRKLRAIAERWEQWMRDQSR